MIQRTCTIEELIDRLAKKIPKKLLCCTWADPSDIRPLSMTLFTPSRQVSSHVVRSCFFWAVTSYQRSISSLYELLFSADKSLNSPSTVWVIDLLLVTSVHVLVKIHVLTRWRPFSTKEISISWMSNFLYTTFSTGTPYSWKNACRKTVPRTKFS